MMDEINFQDIYDILDKAIMRVEGFNPSLAAHYESFRDCIRLFELKRDKEALDCFENEYMNLLEATEPYFEDYHMTTIFAIVVQIHELCKSLYFDDLYGYKTHFNILQQQKEYLIKQGLSH